MGDFRKALGDDGLLIFDGAMGTLLQGRGLSPGESPELFGLAHAEAIVIGALTPGGGLASLVDTLPPTTVTIL